jgi:hypothetical protein
LGAVVHVTAPGNFRNGEMFMTRLIRMVDWVSWKYLLVMVGLVSIVFLGMIANVILGK